MKSGLTEEALEFFRKQGRRGGKLGSKARMEKLTSEERSAIATKAGRNRWKGKNGTSTELSDPGTTAETVQRMKKKAKK